MLGSEFVAAYAGRGLPAWEAAALSLAKNQVASPSIVQWPWRDITLSDGVNIANVKVMSDVLAIGTPQDFVRLPLTPIAAQAIFNVFGWFLPTPLLVFKIWQSAQLQLSPLAMVPNMGANLSQYAAHSAAITEQVKGRVVDPATGPALAGIKKHVVISNIMQKGKVVIFGWYRPSPPFPNVFDDHQAMESMTRQPIQPKSNVHGDFYVDYSHGIQAVHPICQVNGQMASTAGLYQSPELSHLVSNEGPLRVTRYGDQPSVPSKGIFVPTTPSLADYGLEQFNYRRG